MSRDISCLVTEERPITVDEACALRLLLFGTTTDSFSPGWTQQGFQFKSFPPYSLHQKHSGPCGVVATVQAYVIYELLFGYSRLVLDEGYLRPEIAERREALARAVANILWQASNKETVLLARKCNTQVLAESVMSAVLEGDGLLEYVQLHFFQSFDPLLEYLYNFIQEIIKDGGCILFLYSLILTHGIEKIKEEMDSPESHLIGEDGFCSQVGTFYKDPSCPIWVIYGDYHFTVLFGTSRNILRENSKSFKLFYIDSFTSKKCERVLKIDPVAKEVVPEKDHKLPVVLGCLYTRWPLADVEVDIIEKQIKEN